MACWTPQTGEALDGWIYQYDKEYLNGIKLTHQPSPWIGDYGDFAIMPTISEPDKLEVSTENRKNKFSHKYEETHPHHYKVKLTNSMVIEVAPTERCGYFKISYPQFTKEQKPYLIIDNFNAGDIVQLTNTKLVGTATNSTGGVPDNFALYFITEFSCDIELVKSKNGAYGFLIKNLPDSKNFGNKTEHFLYQ